jgi:hypothetical protein
VLFVTMFVGVAIVAASWALPGARSSREAEGQDGGALYSSGTWSTDIEFYRHIGFLDHIYPTTS